MNFQLIIRLVLLTILIASCKKDQVEEFNPTPYVVNLPAYFPDMLIPADNPLTVEGVQLGRKLYYDQILHPQGLLSCASCHIQGLSFSSENGPVLAHINLAFANRFMWNGAISGTLEDAMRFEVEDFLKTDISKLQKDEEYPKLFHRAFGSGLITSKRVADALAQFVRTLNSYQSLYDKKVQGMANFSSAEWNGYDIFFTERGDCFHCHSGALFTDQLMHNNALDANPSSGYATVSGSAADVGKYKTPTLRNIEYTAPYMHDGRFQSLEEVINFYCDDLQYSPTVDPLMKNVSTGGVALTYQERQDLLAFLKTLSDESFLMNPELGKP